MNNAFSKYEEQDKQTQKALTEKLINACIEYARFTHPRCVDLQILALGMIAELHKQTPEYFEEQ